MIKTRLYSRSALIIIRDLIPILGRHARLRLGTVLGLHQRAGRAPGQRIVARQSWRTAFRAVWHCYDQKARAPKIMRRATKDLSGGSISSANRPAPRATLINGLLFEKPRTRKSVKPIAPWRSGWRLPE